LKSVYSIAKKNSWAGIDEAMIHRVRSSPNSMWKRFIDLNGLVFSPKPDKVIRNQFLINN